MKAITFLIVSLFISFFSLAQAQSDLDQFYRSKFEPTELNTTISTRIQKSKEEYIKTYNTENKQIDAFVLKNNFYLEKLNKSGEIFYGDEISAYLNFLKDRLLKDDFRKDLIQVYLVNYPQINAFTNDFGNVYMNIGTIAKVTSEEELIIILSHEISHVILKHSLKTDEQLDSIKNVYLSKEFEELEVHKFSQIQELEADSLAYSLLNKCNISTARAEALFQKLKYNANPIFSGRANLGFLVYRESMRSKFDDLYLSDSNFRDPPKIYYPEDERKSTHPTVEKRIELYQKLKSLVSDTLTSYSNQFDKMNLLAKKIMVNTYMTNGFYVDGLYHTLKLLEFNPRDEFLHKSKLKYLILLTQEKYRNGIDKFLINIHGNECNSVSYIAFRSFIVGLSPVDMNLLTNIAIEDAPIDHTAYYEHLRSVADQFLYRNNPELFQLEDNNVVFVNDSLLKLSEKKRWLGSNSIKHADQVTIDEMKKYGYNFELNSIQIAGLLLQYVDDFTSKSSRTLAFQNAVKTYNTKRELFERTLTADYFLPTIDPIWMNKNYKTPSFYSRVELDSTASTAFVENISYYLTRNNDNLELSLPKTLELEENFNQASFENKLFDYDFSGTSFGDKRSVESNYYRYSFLTWLKESITLEDLNFSSVDEEIWKFRESHNIDYLIFNINVVAEKGKSRKKVAYFSDMYLDIETGGLSYISSIPNRLKPTKKNLKLLQYSSNRQQQIYNQ